MNRAALLLGISIALACASAVADAQTKPVTPAPAAGANASGADATFAAWDLDRNGSLSQQEFRTGWMKVRQATQLQDRLRQLFATADANKSGAIEAGEYSNLILVKEAGKSAPPLSRFDANKDGKLQLAEYLRLVQELAPKQTSQGNPQ